MAFPKAPVCVIAFNRPNLLENLLNVLPADGRKFYISIDGPRDESDTPHVDRCVELARNFQKDRGVANVHLNFAQKNLGCKIGVSSAITWGFRFEESLIILEDDINPTLEFFEIAVYFLYRFKDNSKIWQLNGWTPTPNTGEILTFYSVSYAHIWGWCTWKDRWDKIDLSRTSLRSQFEFLLGSGVAKNHHKNFQSYWSEQVKVTEMGLVDSWDLQWNFAMWLNHAKAISPSQRLCGNLGFDFKATHTKYEKSFAIIEQPRKDLKLSTGDIFSQINESSFEIVHDQLAYKMDLWGKFQNRIKRRVRNLWHTVSF